jgi:hypothetical protein
LRHRHRLCSELRELPIVYLPCGALNDSRGAISPLHLRPGDSLALKEAINGEREGALKPVGTVRFVDEKERDRGGAGRRFPGRGGMAARA